MLIALLALGLLNSALLGFMIWAWFVNLGFFTKLALQKDPEMPKIADVLVKLKAKQRVNSPVRRSKNWLERHKPEVKR